MRSTGQRLGGWYGASHSRSAVVARARLAGDHPRPRNAASIAEGVTAAGPATPWSESQPATRRASFR